MESEKNRNTLLLVALIIGALELALTIFQMLSGTILGSGLFNGMLGRLLSSVGADQSVSAVADSSFALAGTAASFAILLLLPSLVTSVVAVIFNALGYAQNRPAFALLAGIFYAISLVLGFNVLTLAATILSFIAYSQLRQPTSNQ